MPNSAVHRPLVVFDMLLPDRLVVFEECDSPWIKAAGLTEYMWRLLVATVEQLKETPRVRPRAVILKSKNHTMSNLLGSLDQERVPLGGVFCSFRI